MLPIQQLAKEIANFGNMPAILFAEDFIDTIGGREQASELPVRHYFADGMYLRSLFIPKGWVATGVIHKKEKFTIVAQGKIRVLDQASMLQFENPLTLVDNPGVKRLVLALEDTTFINVFRTDHTDIETIMNELGAETCEEYAQFLLREK